MSKYEITAQFNVQAKPGSAKRAIDKIGVKLGGCGVNLEKTANNIKITNKCFQISSY